MYSWYYKKKLYCPQAAKLYEKTKENKSKVFQGNQVPFSHSPPQEELLDVSDAAQNSLKKSVAGRRAHIIILKSGELENCCLSLQLHNDLVTLHVLSSPAVLCSAALKF